MWFASSAIQAVSSVATCKQNCFRTRIFFFFSHTLHLPLGLPTMYGPLPSAHQAFSSLVKVEFWTELAARKLDTYRLNDDAQVREPAARHRIIRRVCVQNTPRKQLLLSVVDVVDILYITKLARTTLEQCSYILLPHLEQSVISYKCSVMVERPDACVIHSTFPHSRRHGEHSTTVRIIVVVSKMLFVK